MQKVLLACGSIVLYLFAGSLFALRGEQRTCKSNIYRLSAFVRICPRPNIPKGLSYEEGAVVSS